MFFVPASLPPHDRRPIRAETRATLVAVIARGRRWLDEMIAGTVTSVEQIAARDKCSIRQVNMTISLAFLAPELVRQPSRDDCLAASASLGCAMLGLSI
jgi:site-specific DNA recombinase